MAGWLRFFAACSFALASSMAHAEIKLLCSIAGRAPTIITIDEQAKTAEGGEGLFDKKVFKVG
ncbi:MAG: hypothetical protein E5X43_02185 [Mesorhizobium sp.]|nr:MAG: hypothetical protein EOR45_30420 [Mesorhizobium sp.]TJX07137.1 MAG: hypothetical protein E5X43_02185 [Mesorhizobium sp.]